MVYLGVRPAYNARRSPRDPCRTGVFCFVRNTRHHHEGHSTWPSSTRSRPHPAPTISTTELRDRLGDPELTIIDARPLTGYNGWRLDGEARGGHIPGAVAVPERLADAASTTPEIRRILDEKGVDRGPRGRRLRRPASMTPRPWRPRSRRSASPSSASTRMASRRGRRIPTCRSSACRSTTGSCTSIGCARSSRASVPRPPRGQVPALPRELRRSRGIRRGPHPGRALSRHELARGPGRLEPPLARGDRRGRPCAGHHPRHDGRSSTAATPKATRTRSGRAGAPGRSPPPAR